MSRIYVETSIASFYYEVRSEPDMVARRQWTRDWFDGVKGSRVELVTSLATMAELEQGQFPGRQEAIALFSQLPMLDIDEPIIEIVEAYVAHKLMPNDPTGDAVHLATASYHKCDFLVTWNCKHLANANKFGHIARVNGILGLANPSLVTPMLLLAEDADDEPK